MEDWVVRCHHQHHLEAFVQSQQSHHFLAKATQILPLFNNLSRFPGQKDNLKWINHNMSKSSSETTHKWKG
jgi:hypothetical protein